MREDFRKSLVEGKKLFDFEDQNIENGLLKKLHMYKQGHLLDHHRYIKDDPTAKINLLEDISVIDFSTIDFVKAYI